MRMTSNPTGVWESGHWTEAAIEQVARDILGPTKLDYCACNSVKRSRSGWFSGRWEKS